MTLRPLAALLALAVAGCAALGFDGTHVVDKSPERIKIEVGYDAATDGVNARQKAADHCAGYGKKAVWYGHDRTGAMDFKCE